ncbi:thioredoxin-like isoform X1 [Lissotriton helveticus]
MVRKIKSVAEFDDILAKSHSKLVVIDFTASWCGPCRAIAPAFQKLSTEYRGVVFLKVDVDDHPVLAERYRIAAMPTFVFIKDFKKVATVRGANEAAIKAKLSALC